MSEGRRYTDEEVERILERAAERSASAPARASGEREAGDPGLTLAELQDIGREVGISPDLVADAATSLDRVDAVERRWGLPLSVSRTVPLPRNLTEREWEQLVARLRETFRARGKVREHGTLREWYNGSLHALIEPTGDGYRLRMGTTKGSARRLMAVGSAMWVTMAVLVVLGVLGVGKTGDDLIRLLTILGGGGAVSFGAAALQLPGWSRERRRQMEEIGGYIDEMVKELPPGESGDA